MKLKIKGKGIVTEEKFAIDLMINGFKSQLSEDVKKAYKHYNDKKSVDEDFDWEGYYEEVTKIMKRFEKNADGLEKFITSKGYEL